MKTFIHDKFMLEDLNDLVLRACEPFREEGLIDTEKGKQYYALIQKLKECRDIAENIYTLFN